VAPILRCNSSAAAQLERQLALERAFVARYERLALSRMSTKRRLREVEALDREYLEALRAEYDPRCAEVDALRAELAELQRCAH
jgi:hypothetical protein